MSPPRQHRAVVAGIAPALAAAALLPLATCAAAGGARREPPGPGGVAAPFALCPGAIVDPARGALYLMKPRGGVEAVDLRSGAVRWDAADAAKPLLLAGDLLLAQAEARAPGVLPLAVLGAERGEKLRDAAVPLPPDVLARVDDGLGVSFDVQARPEGARALVSWVLREQEVRAVAPPDSVTPQRREVSGAALVDLGTGRVDAASPAPPAPVPAWRVGDLLIDVQRDGDRLVLRRTAPGGEPLPEIVLGDGARAVAYASADGRHLAVSRPLAGEEHSWTVFAAQTGERLGEARGQGAPNPFFVWDGLFVHRSRAGRAREGGRWVPLPPKVRALRLATSDVAWERDLRDTSYRGAYPPFRP